MKRLQLTLSLALAACLMLAGCEFGDYGVITSPTTDQTEFYFTKEGGVQEIPIKRHDRNKRKAAVWYYDTTMYRLGNQPQELNMKIDTLPNGDIRIHNEIITLEAINERVLRVTLSPNRNDSANYFMVHLKGLVFSLPITLHQDGLKQAARPTTE